MEKLTSNPFSSTPLMASAPIPQVKEVEMGEAGIKRKIEHISSQERGINPQIVQEKLLKKKGNYVEYEKGISYSGDFLNGIPNGKGTLTIKNVRVYEGELKNGYPHGLGKAIYIDGTSFKGSFQEGRPHGLGVFRAVDKKTVKAVFHNGCFEKGKLTICFLEDGTYLYEYGVNGTGKAVYFGSAGLKKSGSMRERLFDGFVRVFDKDTNFCFEGRYEKGKPVRGKVCSRLDRFEGEVDEKFRPRGSQIIEQHLPNGDVYRGMVQGEYWHGEGELKKAGERCLRGHFEKFKLTEGFIYYQRDEVYHGPIKELMAHGFGTYRSPDIEYEGEFFKDIFQGFGVATFANGGRYEGLWYQDKLFAFFDQPDSKKNHTWIKSGTIETNRYEGIENFKQGNGKIFYPNGSIYTGSIVNGLASGFGKVSAPNGDSYEGEIQCGTPHGKGILSLNYSLFEGEFIKGMPTGFFKVTKKFANYETISEGNYLDGKRQGEWVDSYVNGLKMVAHFNNGIAAPEKTFSVLGVTGKIAKTPVSIPLNSSQVLVVTPDGEYLVLNVEGGEVKGVGTKYHVNGCTYTGEFLRVNNPDPFYAPEGIGSMTFPYGVYSGPFKSGKPDIPKYYTHSIKADKADFFKAKKIL